MMNTRNFFFALIASLCFYQCSTPNVDIEPTSQLLVLVVDYENPNFEGGSISNLRQLPSPAPSELPFEFVQELPADGLNGGVSLFYANTDTKVFDGLLPNDSGAKGSILIPALSAPSIFFELDSEIQLPNSFILEDLVNDYSDENFSDIWPSINQLGVVQNTLNNDALIGRYLYQPQSGNEATWKWILFFFEY